MDNFYWLVLVPGQVLITKPLLGNILPPWKFSIRVCFYFDSFSWFIKWTFYYIFQNLFIYQHSSVLLSCAAFLLDISYRAKWIQRESIYSVLCGAVCLVNLCCTGRKGLWLLFQVIFSQFSLGPIAIQGFCTREKNVFREIYFFFFFLEFIWKK